MGDLRGYAAAAAGAAAAGAAAGDADAAEMDAWLRGGGAVVAASERAARALTAAFHRARRAEGLAAWPAPAIRDWHSFARNAWQENSRDGRLVLNGTQEQALWAEIVGASGRGSTLLEGPRQRMAALAMEGHGLLCGYAPRFLDAKARGAWQQDAGAFSGWLVEFDAACRAADALSVARVPLELLPMLEAERGERGPLLLAGFDRLSPVQRSVFDAWGRWSEVRPGIVATETAFYEAPDAQAELAACALWSARKLEEDPRSRLLVVAQNVGQRRGEIERAFLRYGGDAHFEFSLGVPLSSVGLPRGAHLVLRWLSGSLEEREIDWLFSTGQTASSDAERYALTGLMRALRRRGRERARWGLEALLTQRTSAELPRAWVVRMVEAKRKLEEAARGTQTPLAWAELIPVLLENAGWPNPEGSRRPLASAEFQALRRWQQAVDECASLGFDGRRVRWSEFLGALGRALDETLFAPESQDAPIQIAGPAESAGLTADAVWVMGASDDAWPASGSMHPLLPVEVQREAAMPHASAQLDWELARTMTARLVSSGREVYFSYARHSEGAEMRGSRLAREFCGAVQALPGELTVPDAAEPMAVPFEDASRVALRAGDAAGGAMLGGSGILTSQSQCPFKAFATARLGAQGWEAAQAGLTAAERGQLLHAALHAVWGPGGIRTRGELVALADLRGFVEGHVRRVMEGQLPDGVREQMPQRYLELEAVRLTGLVTEWLEFERERVEFSVARTELDVSRSIAGLELRLRLDRIDRLKDGSLLVIDYKSGNVSPGLWEMPRPEDVQLPLYAGFGLDEGLRGEIGQEFGEGMGDDAAAPLGGLVFAKVRAGENCFAGRVGDAKATLLPTLNGTSGLVKKKFTAEELMDWREYIEEMARNFLDGHAEVDPREYPKTCERCDLQAVCRVHENRADAEETDDEEAGDE